MLGTSGPMVSPTDTQKISPVSQGSCIIPSYYETVSPRDARRKLQETQRDHVCGTQKAPSLSLCSAVSAAQGPFAGLPMQGLMEVGPYLRQNLLVDEPRFWGACIVTWLLLLPSSISFLSHLQTLVFNKHPAHQPLLWYLSHNTSELQPLSLSVVPSKSKVALLVWILTSSTAPPRHTVNYC